MKEFTVEDKTQLRSKLKQEGYPEDEIDIIVSMFESERDGKQTITIQDPN